MKVKQRLLKIIRSLVVLMLALGVAAALIKLQQKPQKQSPAPQSLLVEVMQVRASSPAMIIKSYGTVRPSETLNLVSEVKGKIVEMSPSFEEGGFIKKDEHLIRIDPRSYELAVAQRRKELKQLDAELGRLNQEKINLRVTLEIAQTDVKLAKDDKERFKALVKREVAAQAAQDQAEQKYLASKRRMQETENQIALIEPRADQLKAQMELSEVRLQEALLNLDRTRAIAPFEGRVLEKKAEKGQFVNAGTYLGRIYNTSTLEVEVRIPFRDLTWLMESHSTRDTSGAKQKGFLSDRYIRARIGFNTSGTTHTWEGCVARIKAAIDEKTRTLPLVVEVPCRGSSIQAHSSYPLTPGMFVNVELIGKKIAGAYLMPRSAIHPGNLVYLSLDNQLVIQRVEVLRRLDDSVYVGDGLKNGDLVITTPISVPKEGMSLRLHHPK